MIVIRVLMVILKTGVTFLRVVYVNSKSLNIENIRKILRLPKDGVIEVTGPKTY